MQNYIEEQELFLRWFKHHGVRSISQVRIASKQILNSYGKNSKSSLFKVFYPLLRIGLLEFIGEGKYQVSNPAILYYPKEEIALCYNLTEQHISKLKNKFDIREISTFDLIQINVKKQDAIAFCDSNSILLSEPDLVNNLINFPSVKDLISTFKRETISAEGEYYDIINHKWEKHKEQGFGIYRSSKDSLRTYLRTEQYGDLIILDSSINPEYRIIAEVFHVGKIKYAYLSYNKDQKILTIRNINIPILLERVLKASSVENLLCTEKLYNEVKFKNIPFSAIKHLERILFTKIKIE